jgi:hypothetical protein
MPSISHSHISTLLPYGPYFMLQTVITDDNVTESHVPAGPQLCEVIDSRELISRVSFYTLCPATTTGVPLWQLCLLRPLWILWLEG